MKGFTSIRKPCAALALAAATAPRWIAAPVAQLTDVLIAFPALLLAMVLVAAFGASTWTAVAAVGLGSGVAVARVTRAEVARVRSAANIPGA